jgi:hypothetical protein
MAARRGTINLSANMTFTHRLMDDPSIWRHRLVEELELGRGDHVRVSSSYHVELPPDLIDEFANGGAADHVRLLLPLTMRPKQPLLRFDLVGPVGAPSTLLLRSVIASIEADYLGALAASSAAGDHLTQTLPRDLLRAICDFTPDVFREFEEHQRSRVGRVVRTRTGDRRSIEAYRSYLSDGLHIDVERADVERWLEKQALAGSTLARALDETPDPYSSAEQVLLALPRLIEAPVSPADVDVLLDDYIEAVRSAESADDGTFLVALGDYGKRWEVVVETELPLGRAATVRLTEDRPLHTARRRFRLNEVAHVFALGEAGSAHVEVHVSDHRVGIHSFDVRELSPARRPVRIPPWEGVRRTAEFLSLYSSQPDRPYFATLHVSLLPATHVRWTARLILALAVTAALLAGILQPDTATDQLVLMTLLTFPTTFAVALLLLRESTALAVRLQLTTRLLTVVATALLWVVVFARLLDLVPVWFR